MRQNSSFSSMTGFVDATVGVERVLGWWKDWVELGFLDVCSVAVDGLQSSVGVDWKAVGAKTNDRTYSESVPKKLGRHKRTNRMSHDISRTPGVGLPSTRGRQSTNLWSWPEKVLDTLPVGEMWGGRMWGWPAIIYLSGAFEENLESGLSHSRMIGISESWTRIEWPRGRSSLCRRAFWVLYTPKTTMPPKKLTETGERIAAHKSFNENGWYLWIQHSSWMARMTHLLTIYTPRCSLCGRC